MLFNFPLCNLYISDISGSQGFISQTAACMAATPPQKPMAAYNYMFHFQMLLNTSITDAELLPLLGTKLAIYFCVQTFAPARRLSFLSVTLPSSASDIQYSRILTFS